jgi:hypothetical protein
VYAALFHQAAPCLERDLSLFKPLLKSLENQEGLSGDCGLPQGTRGKRGHSKRTLIM